MDADTHSHLHLHGIRPLPPWPLQPRVCRDPGVAASAHPAPCLGLSVGARPQQPRTPPEAPPASGGCRCCPAEGPSRDAGPPRMLGAFPSPRTMRAAAKPPIGTERRIPAARAPPAPSPFIPPLLWRGLAGRCRPSRRPPYPWAARRSGAGGSVPPQDATPAGSRPATPCAAEPRAGRRERGARRRDLGGGSERRGRRRMQGRHRRSLRPSRLTAGPTRTKGPVRSRPAQKSSWLPGPGATRNRVGGWKGSAEAPPSCPQPRALLP